MDQQAFTASKEQVFLLAYRALCREIFEKRVAAETFAALRDERPGSTRSQQEAAREYLTHIREGALLGLSDLDREKAIFDEAILSGRLDGVRALVLTISSTPDVLCSAAASVESDFAGRRLQNLADLNVPIEGTYFSSIPTDGGGALILAWLSQSEAPRKLATALMGMPGRDVPHAVVRFMFEHSENLCISPDWWESLSGSAKASLVRRQANGVAPALHQPDSLQDDGLRVVDWNITGNVWVI